MLGYLGVCLIVSVLGELSLPRVSEALSWLTGRQECCAKLVSSKKEQGGATLIQFTRFVTANQASHVACATSFVTYLQLFKNHKKYKKCTSHRKKEIKETNDTHLLSDPSLCHCHWVPACLGPISDLGVTREKNKNHGDSFWLKQQQQMQLTYSTFSCGLAFSRC